MARPIIGYWKPGNAEYLAPDEEFAKNLTLDQRLAGGYALTPEQRTSLTEDQARQYLDYANVDPRTGGLLITPFMQEAMGTGPKTYAEWLDRNKEELSSARFGGKDPRFRDTYAADWGVNERDPNAIMGGNPRGMSFRNIAGPTLGMIAGGMGMASLLGGAGAAGAAGGAGAASSSTIPGLTGLSGTGTAAGAFPLTTLAPSAIEAGLLPLTTVGGGGGLAGGVGALGAGASMGDLSNIATQSTQINPNYLDMARQGKDAYDNAKKLQDLYNQVTNGGGQGQSEQPSVPYVPYDMSAPVSIGGIDSLGGGDYLSNVPDTIQNYAAGGYVGGGGINAVYSNYAKGGYLDGPGDGMSDSIPATIEGTQPAALADGEYVVCSDAVSHLGNGSSKAGAKKLDEMMNRVRLARTGTTEQGKQINPDDFLPA